MLRKWGIDDIELNKKCIDEVIARIQDIEDPEQVGMVAAQDLVDIVMENYAPKIYNRALDAAEKVVKEKLQDIEYGLGELRQD